MRQSLAVVTTLLGGCSFIYNPDHINRDIDGRVVDVEVVADVDPSMLNLDYAFPGTIYEGAGAGNSRPAVLVVRGEQIAPTATVTVVPMTGDPSQITVNGVTIAPDHNWIAISISAPVDLAQDETGTHAAAPVALVITVDNGNNVVKSLPTTTVALKFLDQLTTPIAAPVDPMKRYSKIDIPTLEALPPGIGRVQLRSMSSITFENGITFDANNMTAGAGGCDGSPGSGAGGATTSDGDHAPCSSGGPVGADTGGLAGEYHGDPQISVFADATPGGGGGGGGTLLNGLGGGYGGGGGGMLSLEASGDLTIAKNSSSNVGVHAKGGDGQGGGALAGSGAGGAGGTLLLRSGGTLSITGGVVVDGGNGGTTGAAGQNGASGHVRTDTALGTPPAGYIGPMFNSVPYFTYDQSVSAMSAMPISLTGQGGDNSNTGQAYDKDSNAPDDGRFLVSFNALGVATPTIKLSPGYDLLCATVPNGNWFQHEESGSCAEIVYLPGQQH